MVVVRNTPALGGSMSLYAFPTQLDSGGWRSFYYAVGFAVLATVIAYLVATRTSAYALRAISEDEPAAQVLGVKTVSVKLWALVIGRPWGAAGVYAFQTGYIEPAGLSASTASTSSSSVVGGLATCARSSAR